MSSPDQNAVDRELDALSRRMLGCDYPDEESRRFLAGAARALRERMTPGQVEASMPDREDAYEGAMHAAWWRCGLREDPPHEAIR